MAAINKDETVVKKISDTLHSSILTDDLKAQITKSPIPRQTLYVDYNTLPNDLAIILHDMGDFSEFSVHFCEAFKTTIAATDELLYTKIKKQEFRLRIKNFQFNSDDNDYFNITKISDLGADFMKELLLIRGTVLMITENKIKIKKTRFKCINCAEEVELDFNSPESVNLDKCFHCEAKESFELISQKTSTVNSQILTIEELAIDSIKSPVSIDILIEGDLINRFEIGDIVIVSGNMRFDVFSESAVNQFKKKVSTNSYYNKMLASFGGNNNGIDFDYLVEANYAAKLTEKSIKFHDLSEEEKQTIEGLKKNPHLIDILVKSFCPKIYGYEVEKEALIYQLIGGLGRSIAPELDNRGEIHILLFGDASTGKTRLMLFSMEMSSKTRYGVGEGVSKPGLTGGVDTLENKRVLTAGDAVMADMGLLVLDELSDVPDDATNALKEIMEKQTATIMKIRHGVFKTRTAVLAGSNPKHGGSYNPRKNFNENLGLGHALMTRFDAIFLFRDIPGIRDDEIAKTILDSYSTDPISIEKTGRIPKELLAKYIFLAKNSGIVPQLTKEAKESIQAYYKKLRGMNLSDILDEKLKQEAGAGDDVHPVSFSARQVESLIRFATARARARFSQWADEYDVEAGKKVMTRMLKTIGIDVETGKYDMNAIYSTKSANQENMETQCITLLEKLIDASKDKKIRKDFFKHELKRSQSKWKEATDTKMENMIKGLERRNTIIVVNDIISLTYDE